MKKLLTDHFDKLLMTLIFFVMFAAALIYSFEWLANLTRDAFLVLTALLGFRRTPTNTGATESGDVYNVAPTEIDPTSPEAIGAVENLKEKK